MANRACISNILSTQHSSTQHCLVNFVVLRNQAALQLMPLNTVQSDISEAIEHILNYSNKGGSDSNPVCVNNACNLVVIVKEYL